MMMDLKTHETHDEDEKAEMLDEHSSLSSESLFNPTTDDEETSRSGGFGKVCGVNRISLVTSTIPPHLVNIWAAQQFAYRLIDSHSASTFVRYQRTKISGEDISGVLTDDLQAASTELLIALLIRAKYMSRSVQSFPRITAKLLHVMIQDGFLVAEQSDRACVADFVDDQATREELLSSDMSESSELCFKMVDGVMKVYSNKLSMSLDHPITGWPTVDRNTFIDDLKFIKVLIHNGSLKSFCVHRLTFLSSKFKIHKLLNEIQETRHIQSTVSKFHSVRKVDNNVQAASCMSRHVLLRSIRLIIKEAISSNWKQIVYHLNGHPLTLLEVFDGLKVAYDQLTLRMLDDHLIGKGIRAFGDDQMSPSSDMDRTAVSRGHKEGKTRGGIVNKSCRPPVHHSIQIDNPRRTLMPITLDTEQTFLLLPPKVVHGAWMALPVRNWKGPSFGDLESPMTDAVVSCARGMKPVRKWQNQVEILSSRKCQTHSAAADRSCSPIPCRSMKSKLSPSRLVVSPRRCSAVPCQSLFVQGHSIGNTVSTNPDVSVSSKHPRGRGKFATSNIPEIKLHRPSGILHKGLAFRSYGHATATELVHSMRQKKATACRSTLDELTVTNKANSAQQKHVGSDAGRLSSKEFSSRTKFKLSVTWSKTSIERLETADKENDVDVDRLGVSSVDVDRLGVSSLDLDRLGVSSVEEKYSSTSQQAAVLKELRKSRSAKFNARFNPVKLTCLRQLFLSYSNEVGGQYYAIILKKVIEDLEASKFQLSEMRLALYCISSNDFHMLAHWFTEYHLQSKNVIWLIEIPRLYDVYKSNGLLNNFQEFLNNIFEPLFEVTLYPERDPDLTSFLMSVGGFDLIDDESLLEHGALRKEDPSPETWNSSANPSFSYYIYYMYANIMSLNQLRREKGLNTFRLRPHCFDSGSVQQLDAAFLTCDSISHSSLLAKVPVLMYLFYLARVGVTTSGMTTANTSSKESNVDQAPLLSYLNAGLFVSLSTYQPLRTHWTSDPLVEEYRIAAQVLKLTHTDLCELALNSLLISGFSHNMPLVLHKQPDVNEFGQQVYDSEGRPRYRCGFRIGGGVDQDPTLSPQGYPDKGIYVTFIYNGSPAQQAGLQVHDKILQVNGHDLTLATHKKAVEYIGRKTVLNMIVYRKGIPQLQQQRSTNVPPRQPVYDQQRNTQQPIYQSQQQYPPTSSYGQSRYPPQMSTGQLSNSRPY